MKQVLFFIVAISAVQAKASELIYYPTNPSFGGAPAYGSYYLNSAQAQDTLEDPDVYDPLSALNRDPLENFEESLNRQILSQIARRIVGEAFGDTTDGLGEGGEFISGDFSIVIDTTSSSRFIVVEITNTLTSEVTTIEIPRF